MNSVQQFTFAFAITQLFGHIMVKSVEWVKVGKELPTQAPIEELPSGRTSSALTGFVLAFQKTGINYRAQNILDKMSMYSPQLLVSSQILN